MNKVEARSHQPKGGMCQSCKKWKNDCSNLQFETMPVINLASDGIKIVRCTEYDSSNAALTGAADSTTGNGAA